MPEHPPHVGALPSDTAPAPAAAQRSDTAPATESGPLFSPELHEVGTRLVDMLNQTAFLYRYPAFAGVTLACISQHIAPMRRQLAAVADIRERLGRDGSPQGYTVGPVTGPDPLIAAFDYCTAGLDAVLSQLRALACDSERPGDRKQPADGEPVADAVAVGEVLLHLGDGQSPPDPQFCLAHKDVIDRFADRAIGAAAADFKLLAEDTWPQLRMAIFYFLLDMQKELRS